MSPTRTWLARLGRRSVLVVSIGLVLLTFSLIAVSAASFVAVKQTSTSEFCNSCHIMEPYYDSWQHSSHADVECIACHYEPGAVETFAGKFQALSQLAKYVTRTQGTKPWADVSDESCMRSGCHSVPALEGPIAFGRVEFDHRPHLLESRRGRQLRCVSCHSHIVQGEHFAVSESVCFTCHFMPGTAHEVRDLGECTVCHEQPLGTIDVAGQPFGHAEYLARAVDCRECHSSVVEGQGTVREARCRSCHGEVEYLARYGDTTFLHEKHIADRKVECFECHDDIHHGLLPGAAVAHASKDGCGTCHVSPHDGASQLYAGTGAFGVEESPSRMYETRVECVACHTGRSGFRHRGDDVPDPHAGTHAATGVGTGGGLGAAVAAAGEVDCIHCHGIEYEGMLGRWQATVAARLEGLEPRLAALDAALGADAGPEQRRLHDEAQHNLELVRVDGSLGAHNVDYVLDTLDAAAQRIERAFAGLGSPGIPAGAPVAAAPFRSEHGCSTCHLGLEQVATATAAGLAFDHGAHFALGLDCQTCHGLEPPTSADHGAATLPREECASCHHQETEAWDAWDCAACHGEQQGLADARLEGLDVAGHAAYVDKECTECHGEPPDLYMPSPAQCALCHDEGFEDLVSSWQGAVRTALESLEPRLAELERALRAEPHAELGASLEEARRAAQRIQGEGSLGVHNPTYALEVLADSARRVDEALTQLSSAPQTPLAASFPFRSEQGCTICHLGIEEREASIDDGRPFAHAPHLAGGLDCQACHTIEPYGEDGHGAPSFPRTDCASCHHQEEAAFDAWECASCHVAQDALTYGGLTGLLDLGLLDLPEGQELPGLPVLYVDKECTECHGEPPDLYLPTPAQCVLCHDEGYDAMPAEWQAATRSLIEQVETALTEAEARGVAADALGRARERLAPVLADGTLGVHNPELARALLEAALAELEE